MLNDVPTAEYHRGLLAASGPFPATSPCPAPPRTRSTRTGAKALIANGCMARVRGREHALHPRGHRRCSSRRGLLYSPGKASNAGGVATSGLEMSQNAERLSWTFDEVDAKLKGIMETILRRLRRRRREVRHDGRLCQAGANIAGFLKVADAMLAQGVCY